MSLFQCEKCGCCENTALSSVGFTFCELFDWAGMEEWQGKRLCSACGPPRYSDGSPSNGGKWHGQFRRVFLPQGEFKTANNGNLEHIATGDQEFKKFEIDGG